MDRRIVAGYGDGVFWGEWGTWRGSRHVGRRAEIVSTNCIAQRGCLTSKDLQENRWRYYKRRSRGGTIHRCIDISRYFSRDIYRDIIFYNRNFFFFLINNFFFSPQ